MKILIGLFGLSLFILLKYFFNQPPTERQQIIFKDSAKSVQDSMMVLQQICESIDAKGLMNCYVQASDSVLHFRGKSMGKIDSVSASNEAFENIEKKDATKLLSLVRFLNSNFIAGIYHDISIGFWFYSYRDDINYQSIATIRNIYIWRTPQDTLTPAFNYYLKILDRKEHMALVEYNNVQYKQFQK